MKDVLFSATLFVAIWAVSSVSALAQPGSGGPAPGAGPPTETPLDGGASLLLVSGVAYGLKTLRARRMARQAHR